MASSYPGAQDSFTNPTASDTLDSVTVPHADQHANANDAIEAIETTLGTNPQGASATVVDRFVALDSTVASKVASSSVGVANGVASLDATGKVPFAQIPSSSNAHASAGHGTTAALAATYTAGTTDAGGGTGIGATLTGTSNGRLNVDGLAVTTGDRVLVKNQTSAIQNGIYTVTAQGTGGTPFVLTRATDYNNSTAAQVEYGDYLLVVSGTVNALTSWIQNNTGTGTGGAIVIGTDSITFAQSAGTGVPVGGSAGQVLAKIDSTNYNTQWVAASSGTVTSITASSPLTGGTITSSGSIGIDQTALTIAESQVTNLTTDLAAKAPLASPTFTGTVTIPSGASISGFAPLASPALTGTPTVPTAAVDTNTTQAASTAYVVGQAYYPKSSKVTDEYRLASSFDIFPRLLVSTSRAMLNGTVYFTSFTPQENFTVTNISVFCVTGATDTGGTTIRRFGLFTASGLNMTMVARTASDATLLNTNNTIYTRALSTTGGYPSTYNLITGTTYAFGAICYNTGGTFGQASIASGITTANTFTPYVITGIASQTDLPTSAGSGTIVTQIPWARLT